MKAIQHRTSNDVLGAPRGVPIEECHALAITRVQYPDGGVGVVSFWQPTAEELALLNVGRPVRLAVMGPTHAPLSVGVDGDGWI